MKSRNHALAVTVLSIAGLSAAVSASAQDADRRDLSGFDSIIVGGGVDVTIRQSDEFLVEVESSGDAAAEVRTEVNGNVLEISRPRYGFRFFDWTGGPSVTVTLPRLVAVTAGGGSDVDSEGTISGAELSITSSGGSDVELDVDVDTLEVAVSGGADLSLTGTARSARIRSSGGSDLNAFGLEIHDADLQSSGGSDVAITVLDRLVGQASGGSDVVYAGNPKTVDIDAGHGADVVHR